PSASRPPALHLRARSLLLIFAGWALYAFVLANVIAAFQNENAQAHPPFFRLLVFALSEAAVWAFLTVPIVLLARRFPITSGNWSRRVPLHLGLAVLTHLLRVGASM